MVVVKSGDSTDQLKITAQNAALVDTRLGETFIGSYQYHSGILAIVATAHTVNTGGFFWVINPVGSGKIVKIKDIRMISGATTALLTLTIPRIAISFMTFTGTPSGASGTVQKHRSSYATSAFDVRTAITGLTCVYGQPIHTCIPVANQTAVGEYAPAESIWNRDNKVLLLEGEGLVCWQMDAGTTSDTRKAFVDVVWEDITEP